MASILGNKTDITQLDVVWLYDDFGDSSWSGRISSASDQTKLQARCTDNNQSPSSKENSPSSTLEDVRFEDVDEVSHLRHIKEIGNEITWHDMKLICRPGNILSTLDRLKPK